MKNFTLVSKTAAAAVLFALTLLITACGGGGGGTTAPVTITISGMVSDADTNVSIEGAQVSILDAESRQNALNPVYTDANGNYKFKVPVNGVYEVRVKAQGYNSSPLDSVIGVPLSTAQTYNVKLKPITDGNPYGWLHLSLVDYSNDFGALVILTDKSTAEHYTAVTTTSGDAMMYNLPVADYNITIRALGHETYSSDSNVSIVADTETLVDYIHLTTISGYSVSGMVTFLSTTNSEVDVSLTDPETGDVIPGTNVMTVNRLYNIGAVAPGHYYIRATYSIDGYVLDPDSIVKFGEPEVNVTNADMPSQDIDVTGAVTLISPIVDSSLVPVEVNTATPTFSWAAYSSASDYVLELVDVDGNTIWGGFADDQNHTKQVLTTNTSYLYDGPALQDGAVYRWKVYASKDDNKETTGWKLISSSEEAQGVFRIKLVP